MQPRLRNNIQRKYTWFSLQLDYLKASICDAVAILV